MARALKNTAEAPTYLEFFGMNRAPFARVSEPAQLFHTEQYSMLFAHLGDATEQADHLLVLSGADGSGKTVLLNRYIASLDQEISYATFDEKCLDPNQFYCGLLKQLGFSDISGNLNELRHITREFLLHRGRAGDPVLIIVDNAQLVSPSVLEQLRWLADIVLQGKSVISLVLSGNAELTRIMNSPAMSLLKFGTRVDFSIRAYTEQETDDYVRHRLRLAGGSESLKWVSESRPLIHRFTGGNPRLINRLCNALLAEALSQNARVVDEGLVRKVAAQQKFVPHVMPVKGQGRRKSDRTVARESAEATVEERISQRESPPQQSTADFSPDTEAADTSVEELLSDVQRLSFELEAARARAEKVLQDVDARDSDINALIGKIEQQAKEIEHAERKAQDEQTKFEKLSASLQSSEQRGTELQEQLKDEKKAARKTRSELSKAKRQLEKLEQRKADLQESVRGLKSEQSKAATQARRAQKAQDKKISELEQSVADLHEQSEALRARAEEADRLEETLASKETYLRELQSELDEYVEELTATQVQLAEDMTGKHRVAILPDADAYAGPIGSIDVYKNGQLDQVVSLDPGLKRLMIGRGDDSELCLKSKFVSRHHALIFLTGERAYIEDLRSYNGTIVNASKISRRDLMPDDTITIGDYELRPRAG